MTWTPVSWEKIPPEMRQTIFQFAGGWAPARTYLGKGKKSMLLLHEDNDILIFWEPTGKTVGSWRGIYRDTNGQLQRFPEADLMRGLYEFTPAEKRKVDRHGRIKNWKDYAYFLNKTLIPKWTLKEGDLSEISWAQTERLPLFTITSENGEFIYQNPLVVGFPFEPAELYLINWTAKSPRIIGD